MLSRYSSSVGESEAGGVVDHSGGSELPFCVLIHSDGPHVGGPALDNSSMFLDYPSKT